MNLSGILNQAHLLASKSSILTNLAVKLRNQCNWTIRHYISMGSDFENNGERWLVDVLSPRIKTFIDVGANIGDWSQQIIASTGVKQALLFEPSKNAFARLVSRFGHTEGIVSLPAAVSDTVGTATFFEEPDTGVSSSLVSGWSISDACISR